jgi:hypothetical protein
MENKKHNSTPDKTTPEDSSATAAQPYRRKRRRRQIILLGIFLCVLLLLATAPYLLSTAPGTRLTSHLIGSFADVEMEIEDLSLTWLGPCYAENVRVRDETEREIFLLEKGTCARGVWHLLTHWENFQQLDLEKPCLIIHIDELEDKEPKPMPEPHGNISLREGEIHLVRSSGHQLTFRQIQGQITLATLDDIQAALNFVLKEGGKVQTKIKLSQLTDQGFLTHSQAVGNVDISSESKISLKPILEFALNRQDIEGRVDFQLTSTFGQGKIQTRFTSEMQDLYASHSRTAALKPLTFRWESDFQAQSDRFIGNSKITGKMGELGVIFAYRHTTKPTAVSSSDILAFILEGRDPGLPDVDLDVKGKLDLPIVAEALPSLIHLKPGIQIETGQLHLDNLTLHAKRNDTSTAALDLHIRNLKTKQQNKIIFWEPISSRLDAQFIPEKGLYVPQFNIASSFAQAQASGSVKDFQGRFDADLSKLQDTFTELFDLGNHRFKGQLKGDLKLSQTVKEQLDIEFHCDGSQLQYRTELNEFRIESLTSDYLGSITYAEKKPQKITARKLHLNFEDRVLADLDGWYDFKQDAWQGQITIPRGEFAYVLQQKLSPVSPKLKNYDGNVWLQTSFQRADATSPIRLSGQCRVQNLTHEKKPLSESDISLSWTDVQLTPKTNLVQIAQAKLDSEFAQLQAQSIQAGFAQTQMWGGQLSLQADLPKCAKLADPFLAGSLPKIMQGKLTWDGNIQTKENISTFLGTAAIENFQIGAGKTQFLEPKLVLNHHTLWDQKQHQIELRETCLTGDLLQMDISGAIKDYQQSRTLDLTGSYKGDWEKFTALLHQFIPATQGNVVFTGISESDFTIRGPAREPAVRPTFHGIQAQTALHWTSGEIFGLSLDPGTISPSLQQGKIYLADKSIPSRQGKVQLHNSYVSLEPNIPTLYIEPPTWVLENVSINPKLADYLLSRFNPIFANLSTIEGKVSLQCRDLVLPLDRQYLSQASGAGILDISQLKLEPKGFIMQLLSLAGILYEPVRQVSVKQVEFSIRDGKIEYDNFTISLIKGFDLRFSGSVGLHDDRLDLKVSMPITTALLEKLKVKGPVTEFARVLQGLRVDIPILGDRKHPKLDLSHIPLQDLLKRAMDLLLKNQVGNFLEQILSPKKLNEKKSPPDETPEQENAPPKQETNALDSIFDIFQENLEKRKQKETKPD